VDNYKDVMVEVDGERRAEMVFEDIRRVLEGSPWRIMVNGPPGSGKGAQVANIVSKLGCVHMTTGMIAATAMRQGTELGKQASAHKDAGEPIPDELLVKMIAEQLISSEVEAKGWVLDGFPRNEQQVSELNKALIQPDRILLVDVPEASLVAHMTSRRFDPETNQSYFLDAKEQPAEDVLSRLEHREFDTQEKVQEIISPYYATKSAIMSQNGKKCCVVDGEGTFPSESADGKTADEVWKGVCTSLYGAVMKAEKRKKKTEAEHNRKLTTNPSGEPWKLFITGPPASGKGALCEQIVAEYGLVHLSTGGIYHAAMKKKIPAAAKAKEAILNGISPIPDDIMVDMVKGLVESDGTEAGHGWLLDGFPRNKEQAEKLKAAGIIPDKYLVVEVDEKELLEFSTKRVLDPETNTMYHLTTNPPPEEAAARCVQRADDAEDVVKGRLVQYQTDTAGATAVYEAQIAKIAGSTSTSEAAEEDVLAKLKAVLT